MTRATDHLRRLAIRLRVYGPIAKAIARFARFPIRVKLTLAFAGLMVVLFGGLALLLYTRFEAGLDAGINGALRTRAAGLASVVRAARHGERPPLPSGEDAFAQILDAHGRVLDSTPGLGGHPLLPADQVDSARVGTVLIDREGERLLARQLGTGSRIEVVGVSSAERDHALQTLGDLLFIGGPIVLVLTCAAGYALASGALAPVENMRRRASRISDAGPSARLPVPEAHDELHRLGETLNEMLARLEQGLARERAFVADAGHELRTPLSILKLELEFTLAKERSPVRFERALRSAAEEVDRLVRLAEDLLVIARADQGRMPVHKARVEVGELMRAIAKRFAGRAGEDGRAVIVEGAAGLTVDADPARLEQALTNMVDNALRHGEGSVTLSADERDGGVEIHVRDRGVGFPSAFLPRAFERFSRADAARAGRGSGLGLSIVAAIAKAHGGHAGVANRPGGGADAWLLLPHATAPPSDGDRRSAAVASN
jgi:two-component system, OmpR family, sensor kinase